MSLPQYDMSAMIANIKRRCSVPTSQLTFTDADFTDLCTDELQGEVVPLLMSAREEFFVDHVDVATPSGGVIPFPTNTVASKVRSVCYLKQSSPLVLVNLPRIDLDVVAGVGFANYQTLAGFYVEGDNICLFPPTSVPVGTIIRIYYYKRAFVLADPLSYGQVSSIDTMSNTLVLDYVPTSWVAGTVLNSISSVTPFAVTSATITVSAVSSPSVVVDDVTGIVVGDYVSGQLYSAIPQIPIEMHAYLAQLTAAKCLEGLGDNEGMQVALNKAEMLKKGVLIMVSQRIDGSVKKVMNPNGGLRTNAGIGRWGRGWSGGSW